MDQERVIGTLLGVRSDDGTEVEIRNCFGVGHNESQEQVCAYGGGVVGRNLEQDTDTASRDSRLRSTWSTTRPCWVSTSRQTPERCLSAGNYDLRLLLAKLQFTHWVP